MTAHNGSVQFSPGTSPGIWLGLHWALFYFFDHFIQSSVHGPHIGPHRAHAIAANLHRSYLHSYGFNWYTCAMDHLAGK